MKKLILVVDDSDDICQLIKMYLESMGYHVAMALDGGEALDLIEGGLRPHLILLDMLMDKMDGPTFMSEFERRYPEIFHITPVVLTSGLERTTIPKIKASLPKPIDLKGLLKTVETWASP